MPCEWERELARWLNNVTYIGEMCHQTLYVTFVLRVCDSERGGNSQNRDSYVKVPIRTLKSEMNNKEELLLRKEWKIFVREECTSDVEEKI